MITVAVTGGIGAGKSTVSRRLAQLGAVVVDSDRLAREVVAPGSAGLAEIVDAFGSGVLAADGSLRRPALAAIVFGDAAARARLEAITHPRVRARFEQERAAAGPDAIVVNDIPLLVDLRVAAGFHLVLTVRADPQVRVARLVGRGLAEADARARIAAQIDDADRDPLTDVWLDNDGGPGILEALVEDLWRERLVPFESNVRFGRPAAGPYPVDPPGPGTVARVAARVAAAAAGGTVEVVDADGAGTGGVMGLQLTVPVGSGATAAGPALTAAGFPPLDGPDVPAGAARAGAEWWHGNADPGRPVRLRVLAGTVGRKPVVGGAA